MADRAGVVAAGAVAVAVMCCAAAPALLAVLGGLSAVAIGGGVGGVLMVIALGLAAVGVFRRRSRADRRIGTRA